MLILSPGLSCRPLPSALSPCSLEMPKDELPNHNCIKHLRSVVQQQQTRIAELEKTSAEHKHQLAEQVAAFPWVSMGGGLVCSGLLG